EDLGRAHGACAQHYLAHGAHPPFDSPLAQQDALRAASVQEDAQHDGVRQYRQVGALAKVGIRRAPADSPALRELDGADAVERGAIEIGIGRDPGGLAGLQESARQRVQVDRIANMQRSPVAMEVASAAAIALAGDELLQQAGEVPYRIARRGPAIEILGCPADIHLGVDRGAAADHTPSRPVDAAIVERWLRNGRVVPVHPGLEEPDPGCRYPGGHATAARPGLDQRHRVSAVLRKPARHRAAGRTGAHDHVVELQVEVHVLTHRCLLGVVRSVAKGRQWRNDAGVNSASGKRAMTAATASLTIRLLGGFALEGPAGESIELPGAIPKALVALLAMSAGAPVPR